MRFKAGFCPGQGLFVKIVGRDVKAMNLLSRHLMAPPPNPQTGRTHGVKATNWRSIRDEPAVVQRVGQEKHRAGSCRRHRRIQESGTGTPCGASGAALWSGLFWREVNWRCPFEPQMARPPVHDRPMRLAFKVHPPSTHFGHLALNAGPWATVHNGVPALSER